MWASIVVVAVVGGLCVRRAVLDGKPRALRSFRTHDGGRAHHITSAMLPYAASCSLAAGDCVLLRFPSGKTLALWAQRSGGSETESGLACYIGEKPFVIPESRTERLPDGSTVSLGWDSYIQNRWRQGVTSQLRIDDYFVKYTVDPTSAPKLDVDVYIW